jgi:hypothetical protein
LRVKKLEFKNSLYDSLYGVDGVDAGDLQLFKKNYSFIYGDLLAFWKI